MKFIFKRILPCLCLSAVLMTSAYGQQARIATIDLKKVFEKYWKREQAEAALKDRGAEMDKDYKAMMEDYNKTKETYNQLVAQANDQTVNAEEREKRKTAAESKLLELKTAENTIRAFETNAREQLELQKKRMRDTILGEIRTSINAKAKSQAYTIVFDTAAESANNTPFMLYFTTDNDLTDDVLKQLNAAAPTTAAPVAPKLDDKKK